MSTLPRIPPYNSLDVWRGLAALWVVMLHCCLAFIANGHPEARQNPIFEVSLWGQLGVVIFFVISGYCITGAAYSSILSGKSIVRYGQDRIKRIYPPYLIAWFLAIIIAFLMGILESHHLISQSNKISPQTYRDFTFWLTNLTLTQLEANKPSLLTVAWSLCYEVSFYLIIGVFLALGRFLSKENLPKCALIFFVACNLTTIASLVWLCIAQDTCPFPLRLWYQFGFGALLFALIASKTNDPGLIATKLWTKILGVLCVALLFIFAGFRASQSAELGHTSPCVQAFVCVFFFLTLFLLWSYDKRIVQSKALVPLIWLGTISYSVYLTHLIFIPFVDAGLRKIGLGGSLYFITYLMQILVAVGAGQVFFMLIEKRFISVRQVKRIETELVHPVS